MMYYKNIELSTASIFTLREIAKEAEDGEVLDWLAKLDDPIVLEYVAKNRNVYTKTIDSILERLDAIAEKIEKENIEILDEPIYDNYSVEVTDSKSDTFKTRIYFACGRNPQISSSALDNIIKSPIKVLIRRIGYHRLDNFFLANPKISKESIEWILSRPIFIGADTVRFLSDSEYLHQLANQIINLACNKNWFSEQSLHRILIEFGNNAKVSGETIELLIQFARQIYSNSPRMNFERLEQELIGFARHPNIYPNTLDMLALGQSKKVRDAVDKNKNTSEETRKKLEYMKKTM